MNKEDMKVILKSQQGELDAMIMYQKLAKVVKEPKDAEVFRQLAVEEGGHALVFKKLSNVVLKPKAFNVKAIMVPKLYRILGKKKVYPMIAKGEYDAEKNYAPVVEKFKQVQSVKEDEHRHGNMVMQLL
ncbi:MAG: rubrerythrin [Lachnospiraceae bacterium]|nr:rubrerythrin [Lachnospiraceae bacterium]